MPTQLHTLNFLYLYDDDFKQILALHNNSRITLNYRIRVYHSCLLLIQTDTSQYVSIKNITKYHSFIHSEHLYSQVKVRTDYYKLLQEANITVWQPCKAPIYPTAH